MKKIHIKILTISLIFLLFFSGFSISKQIEIFDDEIIIGPYTQNVTNTSITILWETDTITNNNRIEYGNTTNYEHIDYGKSDTYHHEITIHPTFSSGHYRVISDNIESRDFEFKLESHCQDKGSFTCVLYGDSRGIWDNWTHATKVANAINTEKPDFAIHLGDMVDNGTIHSEWTSWLNLMRPLMQNITVFGVLGNHEENADRYFEIFALPNNEKWYSFDYGPCHFIILDQYNLSTIFSQYNWLKKDLSTTNKPIKIVCFHTPIFCSEGTGHKPRVDLRNIWEPIFSQYDVNLVFQSHNHNYQRTNPINGITYVVSGGGGGPLYRPGNAEFINTSKMAYHYCLLNVSLDTNTVKVTTKGINEEIYDEFIINTSQPPIPEAKIAKPEKALYLFNQKIRPYKLQRNPIIIGKIDIDVISPQNEIEKVEFYVDGDLEKSDYISPHSYKWNKSIWNNTAVFFRHYLEIFAYDNFENIAYDKQIVWRIY